MTILPQELYFALESLKLELTGHPEERSEVERACVFANELAAALESQSSLISLAGAMYFLEKKMGWSEMLDLCIIMEIAQSIRGNFISDSREVIACGKLVRDFLDFQSSAIDAAERIFRGM